VSNISFIIGSTITVGSTTPKGWFGSNTATSLGGAAIFTESDELVSRALAPFAFYFFTATIGNVLLSSISMVSAVPSSCIAATRTGWRRPKRTIRVTSLETGWWQSFRSHLMSRARIKLTVRSMRPRRLSF
jgi:hypothetical protein